MNKYNSFHLLFLFEITFLFDSGFMWVVSIPFAYVLSRYTALPIEVVYAMCQGIEILKCIVGFVLLKKGVWLNNIVEHKRIFVKILSDNACLINVRNIKRKSKQVHISA